MWDARASDPAIVDSIVITETISLAKERFARIVPDYLSLWASETGGDPDEFAQLSERLRQIVVLEVRNLWHQDDWHSAWFESRMAFLNQAQTGRTAIAASPKTRFCKFLSQHSL